MSQWGDSEESLKDYKQGKGMIRFSSLKYLSSEGSTYHRVTVSIKIRTRR